MNTLINLAGLVIATLALMAFCQMDYVFNSEYRRLGEPPSRNMEFVGIILFSVTMFFVAFT